MILRVDSSQSLQLKTQTDCHLVSSLWDPERRTQWGLRGLRTSELRAGSGLKGGKKRCSLCCLQFSGEGRLAARSPGLAGLLGPRGERMRVKKWDTAAKFTVRTPALPLTTSVISGTLPSPWLGSLRVYVRVLFFGFNELILLKF